MPPQVGRPVYGWYAQPGVASAQNPYVAPPEQMSRTDEKMWAVFVHLGGLLLGVIAPLVGYLVLKDRGPFIRSQAVTALNFQLTILLAYIAGALTSVLFAGILIIVAAAVVSIVFAIIAAVKAHSGQWYKYPIAIPFVS